MIIQKAFHHLSHLPKLLSYMGTPTMTPKSLLVDIRGSGFPYHHFGFSTENPAPQETPQSGKAIHLVLGLFPIRIMEGHCGFLGSRDTCYLYHSLQACKSRQTLTMQLRIPPNS